MAKVSKVATVKLTLNPDKGGGWLAELFIDRFGDDGTNEVRIVSAWKNASAGKRWIKEQIKERTPRKSIKFETLSVGENGKPTSLGGQLTYKE